MTTRISRMFRQNEAGFTLVEMMVALVLISTIAIGAAAGIFHLLNTNSINANTVSLTTNINRASDSLVPDVQMCELEIIEKDGVYTILNIGQADDGGSWEEEYPETGVVIFTHQGVGDPKWLCLEWEWEVKDTSDQTEYYQVIYDVKEDGMLYRTQKIYKRVYDSEGNLTNENAPPTSETSTMIAQYIDEGATNWKLIYDKETNDATVEITISTSIDGYKPASESRTIQVVPRVQLPPADS